MAEPSMEEVSVSDLTLYPSFGRDMIQARLMKLRREWNPAMLQSITVSLRADGTMLVIEGNHRVTVAREKGYPAKMKALVHTGLTEQQEAELYVGLGDVVPQTPMDIFRAEVRSERPEVLAVKKQVEHAGFRIGNRAANGLKCVRTLKGIAEHYDQTHVYTTLSFFRDAFGPIMQRPSASAIAGVAGVLWVYRDKLDVPRLQEVAAGIGPARLDKFARDVKFDRRISLDAAYATLLVEGYNQGLRAGPRGKKLEDWAQVAPGQAKEQRELRRAGTYGRHGAVWNEKIGESDARPS